MMLKCSHYVKSIFFFSSVAAMYLYTIWPECHMNVKSSASKRARRCLQFLTWKQVSGCKKHYFITEGLRFKCPAKKTKPATAMRCDVCPLVSGVSVWWVRWAAGETDGRGRRLKAAAVWLLLFFWVSFLQPRSDLLLHTLADTQHTALWLCCRLFPAHCSAAACVPQTTCFSKNIMVLNRKRLFFIIIIIVIIPSGNHV